MGATDVTKKGYPKNQVRGSDFSYSPGCGGIGGGSCVLPATFRYIYWPIYGTNFAVYNRKLTLLNTTFKSNLNAGNNGFCPNSNGASQDYDILLCYQPPDFSGVLDPVNIVGRATVPAAATLPFEVTFEGDQIPQPSSLLWGGIVYVVIDLYETGRMIDGNGQRSMVLKTTNFDYDERL